MAFGVLRKSEILNLTMKHLAWFSVKNKECFSHVRDGSSHLLYASFPMSPWLVFGVLQYRLQLGKWWPYEEEGRNLTGRALRKETRGFKREN